MGAWHAGDGIDIVREKCLEPTDATVRAPRSRSRGTRSNPYLLRGVEITLRDQTRCGRWNHLHPMTRGFVYLAVVLSWRLSITISVSAPDDHDFVRSAFRPPVLIRRLAREIGARLRGAGGYRLALAIASAGVTPTLVSQQCRRPWSGVRSAISPCCRPATAATKTWMDRASGLVHHSKSFAAAQRKFS
jgi:hypothetical protein